MLHRSPFLAVLILGLTLAIGGQAAASCMDEVRQLTSQLGLAPQAPPAGGTAGETPATTESRGLPPEATTPLNGAGPALGDTIAARRSEVLASMQAARAAAAQGDEQGCDADLEKARSVLELPQP